MPLAKHRPNFSELIVIAAQQRQKIDKKQRNVFDLVLQELKKKNSSSRRTINRASTIAPITEKEEVEKEVHQEERDEKIKMKHSTDSRPSSSFMTNPSEYFFSTKGKDEIVLSSYLMYSTRMNSFINAIPCKISRFLAVGIAACSLTIEASTNEYNSILYTLDIVIDIHFIFFGILKIFSWYAKAEIKRLVHRKVEYWDLIKYSGLSDTIFSTLSLSFGHSYLGQWFRLVRLLIISTVSLQQLPHIDVLVVSYLTNSSSISSHISHLFLVEWYNYWCEEFNINMALVNTCLLCICCLVICLIWEE